MKKLITLLALAFVAFLPIQPSRAAEPESLAEAREVREYNVRNFDGLDISWIYKVELTRSNRYSVSVDAPEFILPYLRIEVRGGVLCMEVRDMPREIRRKMESGRNEVRAAVSMPELMTLRMSGAASLSTRDEFLHKNNEFTLRLSGASSARGLSVRATEADIECSGASRFDLKGDFDRVDLELSGAANGQLDASPKVAEMEMSGSAKLNWKGKAGKVGVTASGAAGLNFEGSATELRIGGSGAARINAAMAPARDVSVNLSGAAKCDIDVQGSLDANLSGAASCRYHGTDAVRVTTHAVSRGASLTRY
jgi:hypothetical protein